MFPIARPGVSRHLRVLREAGLVEVRAEAQSRVYSLRADPLADLDAWLGRTAPCGNTDWTALRHRDSPGKARTKEHQMTDDGHPRILGSLRSAAGTGVVRLEGRYDTDIDDLWDALTDPGAWPAGMARSTATYDRTDSSGPTTPRPTSRARGG